MTVLLVLSGFAAGFLICWPLVRARAAAEKAQSIADLKVESGALAERLLAKESALAEQRALLDKLTAELEREREQVMQLSGQTAELHERLKGETEKNALLLQLKEQFSDAFKALASDALKSNNQSFLELARTVFEKLQAGAQDDLNKRQTSINELLSPMRLTLTQVDARLQELDKSRAVTFTALSEQIKGLAANELALKNETANLVKALRAPTVRGRWGEIQLRRVVEMAGMLEYCDFREQESTPGADSRLRPDLIVKLPNNKQIVVDAKAPLAAYLEALEAPDEQTRLAKLQDHARQIRAHLAQLGQKSYWEHFKPAPEFAVLFLPGEIFFSAALEQDPSLIEVGVTHNVILATPTTLIALLKAVAYGWRQEQLAKNAEEISSLGKELYERVRTMSEHFAELRKALERGVDAYNRTAASLERRVLVSARKFKELGPGIGDAIEALEPIEKSPRLIEVE